MGCTGSHDAPPKAAAAHAPVTAQTQGPVAQEAAGDGCGATPGRNPPSIESTSPRAGRTPRLGRGSSKWSLISPSRLEQVAGRRSSRSASRLERNGSMQSLRSASRLERDGSMQSLRSASRLERDGSMQSLRSNGRRESHSLPLLHSAAAESVPDDDDASGDGASSDVKDSTMACVYERIDNGAYVAVRKHLAQRLNEPTPSDAERMQMQLALAVLQGVSIGHWEPPTLEDYDPAAVADALAALTALADESPAACLALAEYHAFTEGHADPTAAEYRTRAAATGAPFAVVCRAAANLTLLRAAAAPNEAAIEGEVAILDEAAADKTVPLLVSAAAARATWQLHYKGSPPFTRDMRKAHAQLEVLLQGAAPGALREQYVRKRARAEERLARERGRMSRSPQSPLSPRLAPPLCPGLASPLSSPTNSIRGALRPALRKQSDAPGSPTSPHRSPRDVSIRSALKVGFVTPNEGELDSIDRLPSPRSPRSPRRGGARSVRPRGATVARQLIEEADSDVPACG